jgi:carboxyl-terminal processing protease
MLPASNRGAGMTMGMPDVCLTPAPPGPPVPVPYPNMGMNAMAVPFSPNVLVSSVPALNQGSSIPMTTGDEGGVAHPTIKGPARFTMGNPIVQVNNLPGICLTCPTTGNNMNDALGAVLVPSVTNVFFTAAGGVAPARGPVDAAGVARLGAAIEGARVEARLVGDRVAVVRPDVIAFATPAAVGEAIVRLARDAGPRGLAGVVLDLRGCPGGDLGAAIDLASDFLPLGAVVARVVDAEGDERAIRARDAALFDEPVAVLVDEGTASAAEVLAGALQDHGRAALVGRATYGKGTVERLAGRADAPGAAYATVARVKLPGGREIEGRGLAPDVALQGAELPRAAIEAAIGPALGAAAIAILAAT